MGMSHTAGGAESLDLWKARVTELHARRAQLAKTGSIPTIMQVLNAAPATELGAHLRAKELGRKQARVGALEARWLYFQGVSRGGPEHLWGTLGALGLA